jgi:hypothetical protein
LTNALMRLIAQYCIVLFELIQSYILVSETPSPI